MQGIDWTKNQDWIQQYGGILVLGFLVLGGSMHSWHAECIPQKQETLK